MSHSHSDKISKKSESIKNKGYFLDLKVYEKYYNKFQTPSTPSIPHLFGLKHILDLIEDLFQDHKDQSSLKKIESLEKKLINNLDENSYSELIKLKSQLNRD